MGRSYSVAEARSQLAALLDEVERGVVVEIRRRGRPVATLVRPEEYRRMAAPRRRFLEAYDQWRVEVDPDDLLEADDLRGLRDSSPGREVRV